MRAVVLQLHFRLRLTDHCFLATCASATYLLTLVDVWQIRCTDAKRRAKAIAVDEKGGAEVEVSASSIGRNMVLARWGGMGTHRYQVCVC